MQMNPVWDDDGNEEEQEEEEEISTEYKGVSTAFWRDAVIFLIDASKEMFEIGEEETPFQLSLKCARCTLTNKIVNGSKSIIAIVLYGTDISQNVQSGSDFKHIFVFQELEEPSAEKILNIEALMELSPKDFEEKYGHSEDFSLADALWTCSILFSNCSRKVGHKRILLFTSKDNPHEGNKQLQLQAKTKAKDLFDVGIDIELLHIQPANRIFDVSKFYKDIVFSSDDEISKLPDASEKFEDLLTRVRCKDHKKWALCHFKFTLGEELQIAVSMYHLISMARKPTPTKVSKADNAEVKRMSKSFLANTGEILIPSDLKNYQEYGGKKIYFECEELKMIKAFGPPGLLLMGFKPMPALKSHHYYRCSQFLYPDEKSLEGSTRLFFALLQQCQKRQYLPICRLIARNGDAPRFVALLPQDEETDDRGAQVVPPGFHVVFLPYMEDIRNLAPEGRDKHEDAVVEKAKEIIKKLQFSYHPESFENPVIQKHWKSIEALALNRDVPEEITDYTLPSEDIIEERAGKLINEFKVLIGYDKIASKAVKRKLDQAAGTSGKKTKAEGLPKYTDVEKMAKAKQLNQLKVNVLKEFCKSQKIKCGSKKADMIEAIESFFLVQ